MTQPEPDLSRLQDSARHDAAEHLRAAWARACAETLAALEAQASGKRCMRELTRALDQALAELWQRAAQAGCAMPLALLAVGGYGRRELFLHSDIDILILLPEAEHAGPEAPTSLAPLTPPPTLGQRERETGFLLYAMWDSGIKISHQVGSIPEVLELAGRDVPWCTSLLDARLVAGSAAALNALQSRLRAEVLAPNLLNFVEAKLAERDTRHARWGESRYLLEPQIKDGKGGLRDLQTLYWLGRATHGIGAVRELTEVGLLSARELAEYRQAASFLSAVRMHLHAVAGRAEERLTFEYQRALALRLGFRGDSPNAMVERFMKRYFQIARSVGRLTRAVCAALEEEKKRKPPLVPMGALPIPPFALEGQRLVFAEAEAVAEHPEWLLLLFDEARRLGRDIHPAALQCVALHARKLPRDALAQAALGSTFLRLLLAPDAELHLRRMNESELLGRLIPDWRRLVGMMQFDRYHTFTVDEHILVAVGNLHAIAAGKLRAELPVASEVVHEFARNRVLFLAMLCHDIAKGRGGNHPVLGAEIARRLATTLQFEAREIAQVSWLVAHHELLTGTAFKRDLDDPAVIAELAANVQSIQTLRMLLLMTVADILAVGPGVWNGWKGRILRDLYARVEAKLQGAAGSVTAQSSTHRRAARLLPDMPPAELHAAVELADPALWAGMEDASFVRCLRFLMQRAEGVFSEAWEPAEEGVAEWMVRTRDRAGLFSQLAGSLSASGASIVRCQVHTLRDGTAFDRFWVQDRNGAPFTDTDARARLSTLLGTVLDAPVEGAEAVLEAALSRMQHHYPPRMRLYDAAPAIYADTHASATHTVLEVTAADRIGLLYDLTRTLAARRITVSRAFIATYGEQAVDVFYLKDAYGFKIDHPARLGHLTEALRAAVAGKGD